MSKFQFFSIIIPAIAVLISPLFALLFTNISNKKQKVLADRDLCCLTLRMYNADPANTAYVNALNSIPLVFKDKTSILLLWKETIEHLNQNNEYSDAWTKKYLRLRCRLISEISAKTSYGKINDNDVQNESYIPRKYLENEMLLKSIPESFNRMAAALEKQIELTTNFYHHLLSLNSEKQKPEITPSNSPQSANENVQVTR